jgi:hypothetical protein
VGTAAKGQESQAKPKRQQRKGKKKEKAELNTHLTTWSVSQLPIVPA